MGVQMAGTTEFTVIPQDAHSAAAVLVHDMTAPFDAE
jgi:hypothetical protein